MLFGVPWFVWLLFLVSGGMYFIAYGIPNIKNSLAEAEEFVRKMRREGKSDPEEQPEEPTQS